MLTIFLIVTSVPRSIKRSRNVVLLSLTAYIKGVIPLLCIHNIILLYKMVQRCEKYFITNL